MKTDLQYLEWQVYGKVIKGGVPLPPGRPYILGESLNLWKNVHYGQFATDKSGALPSVQWTAKPSDMSLWGIYLISQIE